MNYQLFVIVTGILDWFVFSIGLFLFAGKTEWPNKWKAWVPGLRFTQLGHSLSMDREGRYCGTIDVLFMISFVLALVLHIKSLGPVLSLFHMIMFIFLFIYRLKLFLRINNIFGLSRKWIVLWVLINWLPLAIIGGSKKYQPDKEELRDEEWEAGTKPANILGSKFSRRKVRESNEGLSINIRERTAKDFGKKRYLLKDIALDIPKKSLVLLLGGSGAGKTTMINAVIGYEKADATVLLNGADVYKDYKSVKHKIGFVPQQNLIRGKDTVKKTIYDAADLRLPKNIDKEEKGKKIHEVMDLLGLTAGCEGLVSKKSGGQLRRICIATELVTDPELFVLDEPDSGLDGVISREIFSRLREVADEDRIVMVITHTPDRVIDLFDKVIVLGRDSGRVGRLAFYGSPAEAREFFGKDSMEQIVMSVNSKDEGGEGRADEFIEKYAAYAALREEGEAS